MKFLIVDDERVARDGLAAQLRSLLPAATLLEAEGILSTREILQEHEVEAVFLDLEMPDGHGLTFLPELKAMNIPVVLFTGSENFATEAFDHGVVDYLLKPFGEDRLGRCLARIREKRTLPANEVVLFSDQVQCWPINLKEIILVEASGSYVTISTKVGREFTLTKALKDVASLLDEKQFVRANRSQIVRLECLESIKKEKGGLLSGKLEDGRIVKFSRRQAQALREQYAI